MQKQITTMGGIIVLTLCSFGILNAATPVVHWTFDGGAATNSGSGGAVYDAALSGLPVFTNGISGQGLNLDGVDDFAGVAYQLADQGTIALWFRPDTFFNYNSVFDNAVNPDWWEMWIYSDGRLTFRVKNNGSGQMFYDLDSLNGSNQWYHIALTWDKAASTTVLYVDGIERGRGAITEWVVPGTTFYIGGGSANNDPGKGAVDDVRVYDAVLTAAEVQAVHAEVAAQAPVVHVTLDGAVTNSGSGGARYDAALYGEPVWTNGWNNKGQALVIDGVDDFASVPYRLNASGSVALWYYAPGPWYNFNSVFDNSVNPDHYECWIDSGGGLNFRPEGGPTRATTSLGSGSNRWYHIVGTWDVLSSNIVLYVNGVERGRAVNTNGTAWPTAGSNFYIGGGNGGNTNGMGIASDLQIFATPLASNRVAEVYGEMGRRGGLLAYVPFDGTAVDVAGSNAVVLGGSPVYVKTQGGLLKGLSCGGVGTSDNASISNVLGSSVGSIALWYYARGPWYNYQTVIDNSIYREYWESWIYNDGRLAFRVSNLPGGGTVIYDLDNLQGPDNWYHLTFTWNRAEAQTKLYVNGGLQKTATLSDAGWIDPDPTLYLAGGNPDNSKGNGVWDEVRVYDRALTEEDILELMVIPPTPPPRGTILQLR